MTHQTWTEYFEQTKNQPPRSLLVEALKFDLKKDEAIDLGSSALNDSKYLLDQNFKHVVALDKEAVAEEIAKELPKEKFTYIISDFESYSFPVNKFDLVNAQYALPFIKPEVFEKVFHDIVASIKANGILVGQLFGNRDEWKNKENMNFHTLEEEKALFSDLEVLYLEEEEKEKPPAAGIMNKNLLYCYYNLIHKENLWKHQKIQFACGLIKKRKKRRNFTRRLFRIVKYQAFFMRLVIFQAVKRATY